MSPALLLALALAVQGNKIRPSEGTLPGIVEFPPPAEPVWYSGDTHEHIQYCDNTLHSIEEIALRMKSEGLNVANILIWDRASLPFTFFVCLVTGDPDPMSTGGLVLQYSIETSQLDAGLWGHLIGANIGPNEARIVDSASSAFACAEMPGLGLGCPGGDGTGVLMAPVAQHFRQNPAAVVGYAHTAWSRDLYHPQGYDWNTQLLATGFTTDTRYLDPGQRLAFPSFDNLFAIDPPDPVPEPRFLHGGPLRAFFPLLGSVDAVLGNVDFFETTFLGPSLPQNLMPPANWNQMFYKLQSAGVRIGLSGGSDRACPGAFSNDPVRTHVLLDGALTFSDWMAGLADGRTSVSHAGVRVDLRFGPHRIGDELALTTPGSMATARVQVFTEAALEDCVEFLVNGAVIATQSISLPGPGSVEVTFPASYAQSAWVAARLCSQDAHTGAIFVTVDDRPIADPLTAEYWMVWCDAVTKQALADPDVFECQQTEALAELAQGRRAFQGLRDVAGFDPAWAVTRYGRSTRGCRGPLAAGITGPVVDGAPFLLTCLNAPRDAVGEVVVSRALDPVEPCVDGVRRLVSTAPGDVLGTYPVLALHGGYAEVLVPPLPPGTTDVYVQFSFDNLSGCHGLSCDGSVSKRCASDGLHAVVTPP